MFYKCKCTIFRNLVPIFPACSDLDTWSFILTFEKFYEIAIISGVEIRSSQLGANGI